MFGTDFSKTDAKITLIRDHKTLQLIAKRELQSNLFFNPLGMSSIKSGNYSDGIYYVNSKETDFDKELTDLLMARGIIVAPLMVCFQVDSAYHKESVWSPIWNIPICSTHPDREKVMFDSDSLEN